MIAGNSIDVVLQSGAAGNAVQGNYLGTDVTGTVAVQSARAINDAGGSTLIGGTAPGAGNVISGAVGVAGVVRLNASGDQIFGNYIGVAADGVTPLPNTSCWAIIAQASGQTIGV